MSINFKNIEYLKAGNQRQKKAYFEIKQFRILEILNEYKPILTGTIPIEIDIAGSDLDIICECKNHLKFSQLLKENFGEKGEFKIYSNIVNNIKSTVAEFKSENFTFEIFGQNISTENQNAYRHMLIEHNILEQRDKDFKNEIIDLKSSGLNTEAAFAKLLKLESDPYVELLNYYSLKK